jgi:hypothetical protein
MLRADRILMPMDIDVLSWIAASTHFACGVRV